MYIKKLVKVVINFPRLNSKLYFNYPSSLTMKNILLLSLFTVSIFSCTDLKIANTGSDTVKQDSAITFNTTTDKFTDSIQIKNIRVGAESTDEKNRFHVSYPTTQFDFINKNEEQFAQDYLNQFEKSAIRIDANAVAGVDFGQHFEVIEHSPDLMAFLIERYTSFGNNYAEEFFTHMYDLKERKILKFSDLFVSNREFAEFVKIVRPKAENVLKEQISKMEYLNQKDRDTMWGNMAELFLEGTAPTDDNYTAFTWDKEGNLTIYFDKYQLASGNFGSQKITLEPQEYQQLIQSKYQQLFHFKRAEKKPETGIKPRAPISASVDCGKVPCVALTFDDGPSVYTNRLLDILKENEVKATFFVLGKSAKVQRNTLLRTVEEGHQIGNHSWDHKDLKKLGAGSVQKQIDDTNNVIKEITGEAPHLLRPPYGSFNATVVQAAKMPIILWNLDPLDWKDRDAKIVAERISKANRNGIILAHDIHKTTVDAIPSVIASLKKKGYQLVTVDQLFSGVKLNNGEVYRKRK